MRLHSSPYFSRLDILPSLIFFLVLVLVLLGASEAYSTLSEKSLRSLPSPGSDFDIHNGTLLAPILRPRVPGSPGSAAVLEHFASFFRTVLPEWHVEFQNSTSKTPATGNTDLPFVNLIARRDPPWAAEGEVGRLTLAAHYDSKMDPPGFIGAIDSAAPCAMILYAARTVNDALSKKWARMRAEGAADHAGLGDEKKGVQIILLDGEEAFKQWSETDSLYGARYGEDPFRLWKAWRENKPPSPFRRYMLRGGLDHWRSIGTRPPIQPYRPIARHYHPSRYSCFSIYSVPPTRSSHPISAPRTGPTST